MTVWELFEMVGFEAVWEYLKETYIEPYWIGEDNAAGIDICDERSKFKTAFEEFITISPDECAAPYTIIIMKSLDLSPDDDYSSDLVNCFTIWCADEEMGMLQWFETVSRDKLVNCEVFQRSMDEYGAVCVTGEMLFESRIYGVTNDEIRSECGRYFWDNEDMPKLYINTHKQYHRFCWYEEDKWAIELPDDAEIDYIEKSEALSIQPIAGADYHEVRNQDDHPHFTRHRVFEMTMIPSEKGREAYSMPGKEHEVDMLQVLIEDFDRTERERLLSGTKWHTLLKDKGIWFR